MDVVLVHDYLLVMRGAERCFVSLCDIWPRAPIATLLYDKDVFSERLAGHQVWTSKLQRLGLNQSNFKRALPALPLAAERLPVGGHRFVVSSSSAFAHGVRPDFGAKHLCYCYTPFRYAWYEVQNGVASAPAPLRPLVRKSLSRIQRWDWEASKSGTRYVAISALSQERIRRYWNIDAPIVYPPVELGRFKPNEPEDYFLVVGELVRHKYVDVALEACRRADVAVRVIGGGADEAWLRAKFADTATFLGRCSDLEVAKQYAHARALIVPNVEEFGITAVEAQASGRPVIAARAGGALETVVDGVTGTFFEPGDAEDLAAILRDPAIDRFKPADTVRNAHRFSPERFRREILDQLQLA